MTLADPQLLDGAAVFSWRVPFVASSVQAARARVSRLLSRLGVEPGVIEDSRVVVSELLGNALLHARPFPDNRLQVKLEIAELGIGVSVADAGAATLPTLLDPPLLATSGRGLAIVRVLTQQWGVRETARGNTVFGVLSRTGMHATTQR